MYGDIRTSQTLPPCLCTSSVMHCEDLVFSHPWTLT